MTRTSKISVSLVSLALAVAISAAGFVAVPISGGGFAAETAPAGGEPQSLITMIAEWQYPDSQINGASTSDAATVNRSGKRTVPSILCKTVLTTKDPMDKVVEYYRTKLKQGVDSETAKPDDEVVPDSGRSVMFHDDSRGRLLGLHIIIVNTDKSSTTLVISRVESESETHIAWTHYLRF